MRGPRGFREVCPLPLKGFEGFVRSRGPRDLRGLRGFQGLRGVRATEGGGVLSSRTLLGTPPHPNEYVCTSRGGGWTPP